MLQYTLLKIIIFFYIKKTVLDGYRVWMQTNIVELKNIDIIETNENFREHILMLQ